MHLTLVIICLLLIPHADGLNLDFNGIGNVILICNLKNYKFDAILEIHKTMYSTLNFNFFTPDSQYRRKLNLDFKGVANVILICHLNNYKFDANIIHI